MFTEEYVAIWRQWVTVIENRAPIPYMNFISGSFRLINSYYNNVIMSAMAPQISGLMVLFSTVYSDADQRKYQSSASLAFVRGIHRWPVYDPPKKASNAEKFPFDDVIMIHSWFMNMAQWFQTKNDDQLTSTKQVKREILRFCVTLSRFLVHFHFQKSWWHKKVNCLPYNFRKWDLTHIACC